MKKAKSKKTRIILSIMALAEVLVLIAGVTFSWMEGGNSGYVKGSDIVISAGSSLTMIRDGKTTTSIVIPDCTLEETSSADGRNFFFPMADNTSSKTSSMKFREGTPSDENSKYLSLDFQLVAGDSPTDVYLGAGTIIQSSNQDVMNALRMSFSLNNGETPIVFKPTQMPGITEAVTYSPITAINTETGVATQTSTETKAYGDYYYSGDGSEHLFHLDQSETLNITLSIWLEGTEFSGDSVANKDLSIYIDFTTTADDLVKYNFVDNGHSRADATSTLWVANKAQNNTYDTMMYIYDINASRYYAMNKTSNTTWETYLPKSITNFYFRRYSIDIDQWWNEWEPDMSNIKTDPNGEHTFINICGNGTDEGTELRGCYGYWQDENDTIRVYFQLESGWTALKCYAWKSDKTPVTASRPGSEMKFSHNNGNKPVYYIDLTNASSLAGIQFNNSNDNDKYEITDTQYFFNGFITWYKDANSNGKWLYTDETNSLIYPNI